MTRTGRRSKCGWVEECEGSIELPLSAVGEGREAVAVARQARVCFNVASFDARPRDAVARESAAAEVVAYAFEQCRVGWVSDASPVGVDGVAVE